MKKLHFEYRMDLWFDQPVCNHVFRLKCIPAKNAFQQPYSINCRVAPLSKLEYNTDCFGNGTCIGRIENFHTSFGFRTEGIVFVNGGGSVQRNGAWSDCYGTERTGYHPIYRYASALTGMDEGLYEFYRSCCHEKEGTQGWVIALMDALYHEFRYMPGVTGVGTSAADAFSQKEGVCQDYSHILLALLRNGRVPARYAAGLLLGEGATHAWTEVWLDGRWIGLDPTHNRLTDDTYIKLSHGRDYRDCMPNRGIFTGTAAQFQSVYAKVEEA